MKSAFILILVLLILYSVGVFLYEKFLFKPSIHAEIDFSTVLVERKILYRVNYNGLLFDGFYDLNNTGIQEKTQGIYKISAVKKGYVFSLEFSKKGKVIKELKLDLSSQKVFLNV